MRKKEYDFIKGIAIICVVLLHSISYADLHAVFAPWHIWQAIPLFVIVSGVLHAESADRESSSYLFKIQKSSVKLIKPAIVIWLIQLILIHFIKGDINNHRIIELIKQGGFGAGGYFIYIAIQNIIFGGIYFLIVKKYGRLGLAFIGVFSVLCDVAAYTYSIDEEAYRVIATRYAFFYAIGLAFVRGLLDLNRILMFWLWFLSAVWLAIIKIFLVDFHPVYPNWFSHTALSGFVAFGFFIALRKIYCQVSDLNIVRVICTFGRYSYYIFLVQMTYFWFRRWLISSNYYPQYGFETITLDLVACLTIGTAYAIGMLYIERRFHSLKKMKIGI